MHKAGTWNLQLTPCADERLRQCGPTVAGAVAVHLWREEREPHEEGNRKAPRYYSLDMTCLVRNLLATAEDQAREGRREQKAVTKTKQKAKLSQKDHVMLCQLKSHKMLHKWTKNNILKAMQ